MSIDPSAGPALRVRLAARAASVRAYLRAAGQAPRAGLVLEEVGRSAYVYGTAHEAAVAPAVPR